MRDITFYFLVSLLLPSSCFCSPVNPEPNDRSGCTSNRLWWARVFQREDCRIALSELYRDAALSSLVAMHTYNDYVTPIRYHSSRHTEALET